MILVFSGTGNSLHVAKQLSRALGDDIIRLPHAATLPSAADSGRVIWVFPVYSWGVPPVVRHWLKTLDIADGDTVAHHAVMTCGDDVGQADLMWRTEAEGRGWHTAGAYSVQMPNTYVLMKGFDVDSEELEKEKVRASEERVGEIARWISQSPDVRRTDVVRGAAAWLKTKVVYPWFVKFEMSPKPFHHTADCTGCGSCARQCPMENIKMTDGQPVWADNCALCLGCYHVCPGHAVAYGKITRNKGQKKILR